MNAARVGAISIGVHGALSHGTRPGAGARLSEDRFWAGIRRTGPDGEVLWDTASAAELDGVRAHALAR